MSWYTTGTVSLTNGSKTVTGVGTKWTNPLIGVCAGQMLILKTANTIEICEIASVQSDTQLTLASQYSGASKKGVSYEIPTAPKVSIEALALRISEMLNYYQQQMNSWQSILTGSGDITLTAPDGRVVTIKSQKALIEAINNAVKKSGDTMTGELSVRDKVHILNKDGNGMFIHAQENTDNVLFVFVNDNKSTYKIAYNQSRNSIEFRALDDVKVNDKSVLKTGDYGIGSQTGTTAQNLDEHLNSGFYGTNTSKIPDSPFPGGGSAASLLVLPSESPHWKVEQLSVVDGLTPRIYYRTDTKNNGKQNWYEVITTANKELSNVIDKFTSGETESRVYSHDKRFYFLVRDDGVAGVYDTVKNKLLWSFQDDYFENGKIPSDRIDGLNNYILSMYNQSFNGNGFTKFPNGMIIQWGTAKSLGSNGTKGTLQPFFITFPTACLLVTTNDIGNGVNSTSAIAVSNSQFRCWGKTVYNAAHTDTVMNYVAIGF